MSGRSHNRFSNTPADREANRYAAERREFGKEEADRRAASRTGEAQQPSDGLAERLAFRICEYEEADIMRPTLADALMAVGEFVVINQGTILAALKARTSPDPETVELLREAAEYVADHQLAQPNDETLDLARRIDAHLSNTPDKESCDGLQDH